MGRFLTSVIAAAGALTLLASGCSSDSQSSADDPTTRALSDPMNYSPPEKGQDLSGGGLTNFDDSAFKKDTDHDLNP
ncbi:MAG TPA: hypothetical protein VHX86_15315 [Tepidisphaeraceae bacterium]|jgi:hypothetical protein|nr:hypothetical protein [Tepidisphaeraceae bacterium]